MNEVKIGRNPDGTPCTADATALAFLESMESNLRQTWRTYTTHVAESGRDGVRSCWYVFMTVSKDIHLRLGLMGEEARLRLAHLIMHALPSPWAYGEVVVTYTLDNGLARSMLCTNNEVDGLVSGRIFEITLEPYNRSSVR